MARCFPAGILLLFLSSCYGINAETSEIGSLNDRCLEGGAWEKLSGKYSVTSIKDSAFLEGLAEVKNHFSTPEYILYFEEEPREIVGCSWSAVRVVFNPKLAYWPIDGLTPQLSDQEQVRVRNRVQNALMEYQCAEGKAESRELMKAPAVYSNEYYRDK